MYWCGISGPPNLPNDIVEKWSSALQELSKDAEFREQMRKVGVIVQYMGHQELRQQVIKETEEMKDLGVRKREE
jgi:tripartite-type tricarboxylate transporter receptor subunit TctC